MHTISVRWWNSRSVGWTQPSESRLPLIPSTVDGFCGTSIATNGNLPIWGHGNLDPLLSAMKGRYDDGLDQSQTKTSMSMSRSL
jgi:hypothetical protein